MEKTTKLAIYARLSLEDGLDDNETSVSIENQINLCKEYANNNNINIANIYFDDGYSGTNFDRPSFRRLINDIETKKINAIVVKDLSRLGRNFLKVSYYLEDYFPQHKVRFISLSDNYDSNVTEEDDMTLAIKNFLNGYYCKECSKKRNDYINRVKQTKTLSTEGVYGYYKKDNELLVDETSANVVKEVFRLFNSGMSVKKICQHLKNKQVMTISYYKHTAFDNKHSYPKTIAGPYEWNPPSIYKILNTEEYTGVALNLKKIGTKTCKKQRKNYNPVKILNHHVPIVAELEYKKAQELLSKRRIDKSTTRDKYRLKNILYNEDGEPYYYSHQNYRGKIISRYYYLKNDYQNRISADLIHSILYKDISNIIKAINKDSAVYINCYMSKYGITRSKDEEKSLKQRANFLNKSKGVLFEKMLLDEILKMDYESEKELIEEELSIINKKLNDYETENAIKTQTKNNLLKFIKMVTELDSNINELDLIKTTINKVTIVTKNNKLKMKIQYKFINNK